MSVKFKFVSCRYIYRVIVWLSRQSALGTMTIWSGLDLMLCVCVCVCLCVSLFWTF